EGPQGVVAAIGERRARVAMFSGCVMGSAFGSTNTATARVLARNGVEVIVVGEQTCCGALHTHAGERERGRTLARRNVVAFEKAETDAINGKPARGGAALEE